VLRQLSYLCQVSQSQVLCSLRYQVLYQCSVPTGVPGVVPTVVPGVVPGVMPCIMPGGLATVMPTVTSSLMHLEPLAVVLQKVHQPKDLDLLELYI
jgi:hypothetical protein